MYLSRDKVALCINNDYFSGIYNERTYLDGSLRCDIHTNELMAF